MGKGKHKISVADSRKTYYASGMFDSHAHVNDIAFEDDRDQVLLRAKAQGVNGWVEIGTDVNTSTQAVALAQQNEEVWATVGVHPYDADTISEADWKTFEHLALEKKVVAIGEVGFDFSRQENVEKQREVLTRFITLATTHHLPVVFHVRDGKINAHTELLSLLESYDEASRPKGVIHTFSGTWEQAQQYLQLGLYLSISGVVTFKNAGSMPEVATKMPLNRMLLETDCPYLTPVPHRGKRNEPAYISLIASTVAQLRQESVENISHATSENTKRLFGVDF